MFYARNEESLLLHSIYYLFIIIGHHHLLLLFNSIYFIYSLLSISILQAFTLLFLIVKPILYNHLLSSMVAIITIIMIFIYIIFHYNYHYISGAHF